VLTLSVGVPFAPGLRKGNGGGGISTSLDRLAIAVEVVLDEVARGVCSASSSSTSVASPASLSASPSSSLAEGGGVGSCRRTPLRRFSTLRRGVAAVAPVDRVPARVPCCESVLLLSAPSELFSCEVRGYGVARPSSCSDASASDSGGRAARIAWID
jgi:hypothetical protein